MQNPKRAYHFTAPGAITRAQDLDQDNLPQTQVLILCVEDALDWLALAREMFGAPPPECLTSEAEWMERTSRFLGNLLDEIDEDEDLSQCRQSADDPWYDGLDELLSDFPEDEIHFDADEWGDFEALRSTVDRMTSFWLGQVRTRLIKIQAMMSGDGEVLAALKRYKASGVFEA